jgi:hypothetical protein
LVALTITNNLHRYRYSTGCFRKPSHRH